MASNPPNGLIPTDHRPNDHPLFERLQTAIDGPWLSLRQFAERAHQELRPALDRDFHVKFRLSTPDCLSELFFGMAFLEAGWRLLPRVTGFDFAFARPNGGRLLVEVVTPQPPDRSTWEEHVNSDGVTCTSMDGRTRDETLLRLTTVFARKAARISECLSRGHAVDADYKVIAISGLRIAQEGGCELHGSGMPPDFASAFLPFGDMYIPILVPRDPRVAPTWGKLQHRYISELSRGENPPVERDAFLSGKFTHVDAVAYSIVGLDGLNNPAAQTAVLHNPTSLNEPANLGMRAEFTVAVASDAFTIQQQWGEPAP